MTKYKALTIAILVVVIATVFIIKSGDSKRNETTIEENNKISNDDKALTMSEKRARSIAETSECVEDATLKDNAFYNESSKTWWIDLDIDKPGCNPACVVYEDETVEINWRCTGLIP